MKNYIMDSNEIRQKYLDFFKTKDHKIIPSAPVVPENDATVLFNTAGMQPLVPYLLWEKHPLWKRLVNSQKCIRTWDIEEVWDDSHLTFFEMLWNWSLWDYFKKESISYSFKFLTDNKWLGIDKRKLAVTIFAWDDDAPRDKESAIIWEQIWIPKEKISFLPASENWWAAWDTGPCWPDTEIFYRVWKEEFPPNGSNVESDENNWMEIWNNVFMEYNRLEDWKLERLPAQNVDTGMWLERITAVLNKKTTVYETDIFKEIINKVISEINIDSKLISNEKEKKAIRVIADHTRTATIMISDGVIPSNLDAWYVLRKLIRIAIRKAYSLGNNKLFLSEVAKVVIDNLWKAYPHMLEKRKDILEEIIKEEKQFKETLEKWLKEFDKLLRWFQIAFERTWKKINTIAWSKAFKLYDTYGFPLEMTQELAIEKWLTVDEEGFKKAFKEHKEKSKKWAEKKFKWWLADTSELTTALHSATHLLLEWLNKVLWWKISQRWANITPERIRFDFSFDRKVTREELDKVEDYVNNAIKNWFNVIMTQMPKKEAIEKWVRWAFWEKYPNIVKVYTMKWKDGTIYSEELCWGPHVKDSENMWRFKIKKEQSSSRWVRRVKAVLIKD